MSGHINHTIIIGSLGADAAYSETKSGELMARLNIATTESWIEGSEEKSSTDWHTVFTFGNLARSCQLYKKGMTVHVIGKNKSRSVLDENGNRKTERSIFATSVFIMDVGNRNRPSPEVESELIF